MAKKRKKPKKKDWASICMGISLVAYFSFWPLAIFYELHVINRTLGYINNNIAMVYYKLPRPALPKLPTDYRPNL